MPDNSNRLPRFWQELKRRKVVRVITVYAASAFVILELVDIITGPFGLPAWTLKLVVVLLSVGLIISVILSWIYDISPEGGLEKTRPVQKLEVEERPAASNKWKIASYISFFVIVALILINLITRSARTGETTILEKSIAVLPFENMSDEDEYAHLGDALTDEIIMQLYKINDFEVRSRTSIMQYKNTTKGSTTIGQELNVNYLLEGTIQRHDDQVRIRVQLIQASKDDHIWGDVFEGQWKDIFKIQIEVAKQVARELKTALSTEEIERIERKPTDNPAAYQAYLKGRHFLEKRTQSSIQMAQKYFLEAISLDSAYALAYSGLANSYTQLAGYGVLPLKEAMPRAIDAAKTAIRLDPKLGEAHLAEAWADFHIQKGHADLHAKFEKAIELDPENANAYHWYAWYRIARMEFEQAEGLIETALDLAPLSLVINSSQGWFYLVSGDIEGAINQLKTSLELDNTFPRAHSWIGQAYLLNGQTELALHHISRAVELSERNPQYLSTLAWALGRAGRKDQLAPLIGELEKNAEGRFTSDYDLALAYLGEGNEEKALEYLHSAVDAWDSWLLWIQCDPRFDHVRQIPEFRDEIRRVWPQTE